MNGDAAEKNNLSAMTVTQKQIAQELGVSWSLVTRALRDHPTVAPETRRRIQEAARRMGYTALSNREARALIARRYGRRIKSDVIAVVAPPFLDDSLHRIPFFNVLLEGIDLGADRAKLDIYLARNRDTGGVPRLIAEQAVDGVIVLQANPMLCRVCAGLGLPVVEIFHRTEDVSCVDVDHRDGVLQGVRHLVELGHRRIAYIGLDPDSAIARERLAAYRDALRRYGIGASSKLIDASLRGISQGAEAADRLLARKSDFSAVVCYNDTVAMAAIQQFMRRGIGVPSDLSVVGFDDVSLLHNFTPALTSVQFDGFELGRAAVELLRDFMAGDPNSPALSPKHQIFPVRLKVRESTAAPPRRSARSRSSA